MSKRKAERLLSANKQRFDQCSHSTGPQASLLISVLAWSWLQNRHRWPDRRQRCLPSSLYCTNRYAYWSKSLTKSWKHIWGQPLSIWLSSKSSFADHSSDSLLRCESLSFVSRHLLSCQLYPSESWHRLCGKCLGSQPTSSQSSSTCMSREAKQSRHWVFHRVSQSVPSQIKQFCLYQRVSIEKLFPNCLRLSKTARELRLQKSSLADTSKSYADRLPRVSSLLSL